MTREFRRVFTDVGVIVFFFVVPTGYPILYAYLYSRETVHEVPVVAVDDCHSSLSREFLRKTDASPDVRIVAYCSDMEEAKEIMHRHKAYALIEIPSNFSSEIVGGRQATVNLYCDMSGLLFYKAAYSACSHVSLDMNKDIKLQRLAGMTEEQSVNLVQAIEYEYVPLYNPQAGFCSYIIPAVVVIVLQQTLLLGITMLEGTEEEYRRKKIYRYRFESDNPMALPSAVLIGKALCYLAVYSVLAVYLLCFIPKLFDLPTIWQAKDLLLFALPLLLACIFFAISMSYFVKYREACFLLFVFASVPLMFISGISWPQSNIPSFWKIFSGLFPSTFGINGFIRLSSNGATLLDVRREWMCLWIQALSYMAISMLVFSIRYRQVRTVMEADGDAN